ncbi:MAG: hypothetical protein ACT4PG_08770 [Panacagrimonas sp.]
MRALLDDDVRVTVVCAREKSRLGFAHPLLDLRALPMGLRHPQWLWHALARGRGHLPSNHYVWTRRAASAPPPDLPDVVYGRAWPYTSLVAAQMLAQRLQKPLMLTKVVEALVVDRPLLLITQAGSPGDRLASQCSDTVVSLTSSAPADVAMASQPGDYARRRALMGEFSGPQVARRCVQLLLGPVHNELIAAAESVLPQRKEGGA